MATTTKRHHVVAVYGNNPIHRSWHRSAVAAEREVKRLERFYRAARTFDRPTKILVVYTAGARQAERLAVQ